jgi:hypothetical protein
MVMWCGSRDQLCRVEKNGNIEQISLLKEEDSPVKDEIRAKKASHNGVHLEQVKVENASSVGERPM